MKSSGWSIGEVAARFDVATSVLRHWEDAGLLDPARDAAGRRRYGIDDVTRVAIIVRSKLSGLSLDRIAMVLGSATEERQRALEAHLADIDRQMRELERWREMTLHALECEAHDIAACPNFRRGVADVLQRLDFAA